jgi:TonB family protein
MMNLNKALCAASLLLMFGALTAAAPAQTESGPTVDCPIRNADARPLTHYPLDWPSTVPSELREFVRGAALVQFEVTADGTPQNAFTIRSTGFYQLDRAAEAVVLYQRYAPAIRDCVPVSASYLYVVEY